MVQVQLVIGLVLTAIASQANASASASEKAPGAPAPRLALPDSETAVAMTPPVLPVRIAGECPSSDPCEFGTNWRACEAIPVYRDARDGAPLLRMLSRTRSSLPKAAKSN